MKVSLALAALGRGPRGGDLEAPYTRPEARRAPHNGERMDNGLIGPHRFIRTDSTSIGRDNEKPWHTMAAYMLVAGRTDSEIALGARVSVETVKELRACRWFQERCVTIANTTGEAILGVLEAEAIASIEKIVEIRDNAESERVALAAAQILLEQAHGKPIQKVVSNISHSVNRTPQEEMEEIQQELKLLRAAQMS